MRLRIPKYRRKSFQTKISGLLFDNDFVEIAETGPALQSLIDIVVILPRWWSNV